MQHQLNSYDIIFGEYVCIIFYFINVFYSIIKKKKINERLGRINSLPCNVNMYMSIYLPWCVCIHKYIKSNHTCLSAYWHLDAEPTLLSSDVTIFHTINCEISSLIILFLQILNDQLKDSGLSSSSFLFFLNFESNQFNRPHWEQTSMSVIVCRDKRLDTNDYTRWAIDDLSKPILVNSNWIMLLSAAQCHWQAYDLRRISESSGATVLLANRRLLK